jgi:hypothetical protein
VIQQHSVDYPLYFRKIAGFRKRLKGRRDEAVQDFSQTGNIFLPGMILDQPGGPFWPQNQSDCQVSSGLRGSKWIERLARVAWKKLTSLAISRRARRDEIQYSLVYG